MHDVVEDHLLYLFLLLLGDLRLALLFELLRRLSLLEFVSDLVHICNILLQSICTLSYLLVEELLLLLVSDRGVLVATSEVVVSAVSDAWAADVRIVVS